MAGKEIENIIHQIEIGYETLDVVLRNTTESQLWNSPGGDDWSPSQIMGHVIEMGPFWASRVSEVAEKGIELRTDRNPSEATARFAAVDKYSKASLAVIRRDLIQSKERCVERIATLQDADLEVQRRSGDQETTLRDFLESHIVLHLQEHAEQMSGPKGTEEPSGS